MPKLALPQITPYSLSTENNQGLEKWRSQILALPRDTATSELEVLAEAIEKDQDLFLILAILRTQEIPPFLNLLKKKGLLPTPSLSIQDFSKFFQVCLEDTHKRNDAIPFFVDFIKSKSKEAGFSLCLQELLRFHSDKLLENFSDEDIKEFFDIFKRFLTPHSLPKDIQKKIAHRILIIPNIESLDFDFKILHLLLKASSPDIPITSVKKFLKKITAEEMAQVLSLLNSEEDKNQLLSDWIGARTWDLDQCCEALRWFNGNNLVETHLPLLIKQLPASAISEKDIVEALGGKLPNNMYYPMLLCFKKAALPNINLSQICQAVKTIYFHNTPWSPKNLVSRYSFEDFKKRFTPKPSQISAVLGSVILTSLLFFALNTFPLMHILILGCLLFPAILSTVTLIGLAFLTGYALCDALCGEISLLNRRKQLEQLERSLSINPPEASSRINQFTTEQIEQIVTNYQGSLSLGRCFARIIPQVGPSKSSQSLLKKLEDQKNFSLQEKQTALRSFFNQPKNRGKRMYATIAETACLDFEKMKLD